MALNDSIPGNPHTEEWSEVDPIDFETNAARALVHEQRLHSLIALRAQVGPDAKTQLDRRISAMLGDDAPKQIIAG